MRKRNGFRVGWGRRKQAETPPQQSLNMRVKLTQKVKEQTGCNTGAQKAKKSRASCLYAALQDRKPLLPNSSESAHRIGRLANHFGRYCIPCPSHSLVRHHINITLLAFSLQTLITGRLTFLYWCGRWFPYPVLASASDATLRQCWARRAIGLYVRTPRSTLHTRSNRQLNTLHSNPIEHGKNR